MIVSTFETSDSDAGGKEENSGGVDAEDECEVATGLGERAWVRSLEI